MRMTRTVRWCLWLIAALLLLSLALSVVEDHELDPAMLHSLDRVAPSGRDA